jgi:hypothetical protein
MLFDGPGAAASAEPSRRWAEISKTLNEVGQDLHKALEQSGSGWSGKAAGAAYDRLSVTAAWATDTGAEAASMRTLVENQADHIARARADMPVPEDMPAVAPDPTLAPAVQVVKAQTDLENAEAAASSAEERAFEVMAAYELNTNGTTGSLSSFEAPPLIDHHDHVHEGQVVGTQHTHASSAGLLGIGLGGGETHHSGWHGSSSGRGSWGWFSSEPESRQPYSGAFSGSLNYNSDDDREHRPASRLMAGGSSSGVGSGSGSAGGSGGLAGDAGGREAPAAASAPSAGGATSAVPRSGAVPSADMQAAAAGQAAVHQASAAPVATTGAGGGAPLTGGADRVALRRFGMDAIGSSSWFGDEESAVVGDSPRRHRDFTEPERVIESVDILGEEHKLPPNVIGDGHHDQ